MKIVAKKALKIGGILFGIIAAVLIAIPFFVNVDKYRPVIESKVGESLNAKLALGSLSLSVFPSLKITTESIELSSKDPSFPEKIISASKVKVTVPLYSLLGSPQATLELSEPKIKVLEKNGKYNFETLVPKVVPETTAPKPESEGGPSFVQSKIELARLNLTIFGAQVEFRSSKMKADVTIDELELKNLGINSPIEIKIISSVNFNNENAEFKGPFEFSGEIISQKSQNEMGAQFDIKGNFDRMFMKSGATFTKAEGVPFRFGTKGSFKKGVTTDFGLSDLSFELSSFKLNGRADVKSLGSDEARVSVDLKSENSKIEDLSSLSPLLKDYQLQGNLSFLAKAEGSMKNPSLDVEVKADDLKGKTPQLSLPIKDLKVKLKVQGTLEDPTIEVDPADFLVGKSDVKLRVKARGLKAPQATIRLESKSLDMAFLKTGKESKVDEAEKDVAAGKALDATLYEMAPELEKSLKNPMLDKAKLDFTLDFGELKLQGARLTSVKLSTSYADRVFKMSQASFQGYNGRVQMSGSSRLNPSAPTYDYNLGLDNIALDKAIAAHAPAWKGQLGGILRGKARVAGVGLRKAQLEKSLSGGIDGEILKGNTSLQLSKIVSVIMKQLPQRPELKSEATGERLKGKFKTLKLASALEGRKIVLKNLDIIFEPDEYNLGEIQFKARGSIGFDRNLSLEGDVFLSPQVVKWPEGVGKSGKIEIPVKLSGPMDSAKPDVAYTISKMGSRVLKKTAEKELKKGVQKLLDGKKPEELLKGIFKF